MNATKFVSTPTARGRVTHLEVDFTGRDGQTHLVTGPVNSATIKTSTRPRKSGLHVAAVSQGMAVCEAVGMDLWAVGEGPRTYWATRGSQFYLLEHNARQGVVVQTPVDAWGTPTDGPFSVIVGDIR